MNKLILAAGSVLFHFAIIVWIFSHNLGGSTKPNSPHQSAVSVFIVAPTASVLPQPPTKVAVTTQDKTGIATPIPITLPQPLTFKTAAPRYFSLKELDRGPLPKSEPDLQQVEKKSVTNLPIKLRLFIDLFGKVEKVVTLDAEMVDQDFVDAVIDIFRETSFLPGRFNGDDVPSYLDIEIGSTSKLPSSEISSVPCSPCAATE